MKRQLTKKYVDGVYNIDRNQAHDNSINNRGKGREADHIRKPHNGMYPILRHFALQLFRDTAFSTNRRFVTTLCQASLWCHFSNSIFLSCVSVSHFGNSHNISNIIICDGDQWAVIFDVTVVTIFVLYFKTTYVYCVFRRNAIAHWRDYSIV